jgi:hypothetical protein
VKTKELTIGFYRMDVTHDQPVRFEDILRRFTDQIPQGVERASKGKDDPIRLQVLEQRSDYWLADMMKIRIDDEVGLGKRDGTVRSVDLDKEEGLRENTAFLYHPRTRTLVIHERRGAVPLSAIRAYFKVFGEVNRIETPAILRPEALERAKRLPSVHAFEIHLAGVEGGKHFGGQNRSVEQVVDLINHYGATKALIKLEAPVPRGRRQEGVVVAGLKNVVNALHGFLAKGTAPEELEKIVVVGSGEGGVQEETEIINILYDRLTEKVQIALGKHERISNERRLNAVVTAWNTRRQYIRSISAKG